jgi:hypothetical protein
MKKKVFNGYASDVLAGSSSMGFDEPTKPFENCQFTLELFESKSKKRWSRLTIEIDGAAPKSYIRDMGLPHDIHVKHPTLVDIKGDDVAVDSEGWLCSWQSSENGFIFTKAVDEPELDKLTKKEIIAMLETSSIEYTKTATKEQLIELLSA